MTTLLEVKHIAVEILKKEIDMLEMVSTLDRNQVEEFNQWYKNNEHYRSLQYLVQMVHQAKQKQLEFI